MRETLWVPFVSSQSVSSLIGWYSENSEQKTSLLYLKIVYVENSGLFLLLGHVRKYTGLSSPTDIQNSVEPWTFAFATANIVIAICVNLLDYRVNIC